ncbi:MAG: hypothetical protein ACOY46_16200 [Bacillota bacterium]
MLNIIGGITRDAVSKMMEGSAEDRHAAAKVAVDFLSLGTQLLRENPEFRDAFARIHTEFFKYPESVSIVRQALETLENNGPATH